MTGNRKSKYFEKEVIILQNKLQVKLAKIAHQPDRTLLWWYYEVLYAHSRTHTHTILNKYEIHEKFQSEWVQKWLQVMEHGLQE